MSQLKVSTVYSPGCPWCEKQLRDIDRLRGRHSDVQFERINVKEHPEIKVDGFPITDISCGGVKIARVDGYHNEQEVDQALLMAKRRCSYRR